MTKAEVRCGEPSHPARLVRCAQRGNEAEEVSVCGVLVPVSLHRFREQDSAFVCRVYIQTATPSSPGLPGRQGPGENGVSGQRRTEGTGAAHRSGRVSPQEGLSGTRTPAPC